MKEFLTSLIPLAFDPHFGFVSELCLLFFRLFSSTPEQLLFPNPNAHLFQENTEAKFEFLGLITGKLLYEYMLTELPLAGISIEFCFLIRQIFLHNKFLIIISPGSEIWRFTIGKYFNLCPCWIKWRKKMFYILIEF